MVPSMMTLPFNVSATILPTAASGASLFVVTLPSRKALVDTDPGANFSSDIELTNNFSEASIEPSVNLVLSTVSLIKADPFRVLFLIALPSMVNGGTLVQSTLLASIVPSGSPPLAAGKARVFRTTPDGVTFLVSDAEVSARARKSSAGWTAPGLLGGSSEILRSATAPGPRQMSMQFY